MKWNPETDSHTYSQLIFNNGAGTIKCGKGYSSTVRDDLVEFFKMWYTYLHIKINLKCIIALNVEVKRKKK